MLKKLALTLLALAPMVAAAQKIPALPASQGVQASDLLIVDTSTASSTCATPPCTQKATAMQVSTFVNQNLPAINLTATGAGGVSPQGASGAVLQSNGASAAPSFVAGVNVATSGVPLPTTTVSGLSAFPCNSGTKGVMVAVTDATTITYNAAPTGGGALAVPVMCTGTGWTMH